MAKLFIDANFLVSLFKKNDSTHDQAVRNSHLLSENDCYISNGVISEVVTVVMMKTKDIEKAKKAYNYIQDNLIIVDEYEIEKFNDRTFALFKKHNENTYKLSFIDCSIAVVSKHLDLDSVVTFDDDFKLFEEISLYELD